MTIANGILDGSAIADLVSKASSADAASLQAAIFQAIAVKPLASAFTMPDPDILYSNYIDSTNGLPVLSLDAGSKYHATGFIAVRPGVQYRRSAGGGPIAYYNASFAYISGDPAFSATFTPPAGTSYMRVSVLRNAWANYTISVDGGPVIWATNAAKAVPNPMNLGFLKRVKMRLMQRLLPNPVALRVVIDCAGDSYTHNPARWTGPFMDYMAAKYGDGGGGWCGFGFATAGSTPYTSSNQPSLINGNVRPATYPTKVLGAPVTAYATKDFPDICGLTLAASGDAVFQAFPALPVHNGCDLFHEVDANASIRYRWGTYVSGPVNDPASYNFAASTVLALSGTAGAIQAADIKAGMPSGAGALMIEWVAGSPVIGGVNLKSAASGVVVNKIAATGSRANSWSARGANWQAGVALLGGDLFVYGDGPNSQASFVTPPNWGAQVETVLTRVRAAIPACDILLTTPPENIRANNRVAILGYAVEAVARAQKNFWAYHDDQPAFGDGGNPSEYAAYFNPDLLHPEPGLGGTVLTRERLRAIEPLSS